MHFKASRLNWGVFFIVLGAVPLAYHQGAVTRDALVNAWQLWPLILVGIGLGIILYRTPAYFVGGLVVAACFGLVFGSAFSVGFHLGCGADNGSPTTITRDGSFSGPGEVRLELQCGTANVTPSNDNQWHLRASNSSGIEPDVSSSSNRLTVSSSRQHDFWRQSGDDTWDVALPVSQATALSIDVNAGEGHLNLNGATLTSLSLSLNAGSFHGDLTGARIGNVSISTNVGSTSLILDGNSSLSGSISTNVGSMNLCFPSQLGVSIRNSESLGSGNYSAAGFVRVGDTWQTQGYATAANKADFNVSTSVGSLTLNPAGGCK